MLEAGGVGGCTRGDCDTFVNEMVEAEGEAEVAVDDGIPAVEVVVVVLVCT